MSVSGLRIVDVGLLEQRYALRLRVRNPNEFALGVLGMSYQLQINGRDFAQGIDNRILDIPPYSERVLDVEIVSGLAELVDQIRALDHGRLGELRYRLLGHLRLRGQSMPLPFDQDGRLLPASPVKPGGTGRILVTLGPGLPHCHG